jgi:hypothetical protein
MSIQDVLPNQWIELRSNWESRWTGKARTKHKYPKAGVRNSSHFMKPSD